MENDFFNLMNHLNSSHLKEEMLKKSREGRIMLCCQKHNWDLTAEQLEIIKTCISNEEMETALDTIKNTPVQWLPKEPVKKAKEIALEHAEGVFCTELASSFDKPSDLLNYAKEVHQWLIAE